MNSAGRSGFVRCYGAIWAATLVAALVGVVGVLQTPVAEPHDALEPQVRTALALLTHNLPVTLWPLALIAIGWPRLVVLRVAGDLLVIAQLVSHGALVGFQLGQQPVLWRYLPHLPLEWGALTVPAAAWLHTRSSVVSRGELLRVAGATIVALVGAAIVETYLVPVG